MAYPISLWVGWSLLNHVDWEKALVVINYTEGRRFAWMRKLGRWIRARMPSTLLEAGEWEKFLETIPDEMLATLGDGGTVILADYGTRGGKKGFSRAQWQGMSLVLAQWARTIGEEQLMFEENEVWKILGAEKWRAMMRDLYRVDARKFRKRLEYWLDPVTTGEIILVGGHL